MIARAGQAVATRRIPTRYLRRSDRRTLVRDLAKVKSETGTIPKWMVMELARQMGRSEQSVRRAVADVIAHPELTDDAPGLSDDVLRLVGGNVGNLANAHELAVEAGLFTKSYPTFYRAWKAEPLAVRIGLTLGKDAMRNAMETRVFEVPHRNALVFLDEMVVPIPCRYGKRFIEQLYLVAFLDAHSREILVWTVLDSPVTADDTVALFAALLYGRVDRDGVVHGGICDMTLTDNAAAFTGDKYGEFARRFTKLEFGRPHTPQDKAKIERAFWTIQYSHLAGTVGVTLGAKEPPRKRRKKRSGTDDTPPEYVEGRTKHWLTSPDALPSFEQAVGAVNTAIEQYNTEPRRRTKRSPAQAWSADRTIVRTVDPILLWDKMVPVGDHKIDRRGIWSGGRWYCNATDRPIGADLSVRILPGIPDRVFVGTPARTAGKGRERYLATLVPNRSTIEGQSDAISARNRTDTAKVGRILNGARTALAVATEALPEAVVAPRPEQSSKAKARAKAAARPSVAPIDLARLVTRGVDLNGPVEEGVA